MDFGWFRSKSMPNWTELVSKKKKKKRSGESARRVQIGVSKQLGCKCGGPRATIVLPRLSMCLMEL